MSTLKTAILTVVILITSWNIPVTRALWDSLDAQVFYILNPLTAQFPTLIKFVNSSLFDWISDVVILVMMLLYFFRKEKKATTTKVAEFLYMVIIAAATIALINKRLIPDFFGAKRVSPSLELSPAIRLSALFPGAKDSSHSCFPGDHATTAFFFLLTYCHFTSIRRSIPVFLYAACMILPRLIVGAHWFTDVLMGSFCIAYLVFTIAFRTRLHAYCVPPIQKAIERIQALYAKFTRVIQKNH